MARPRWRTAATAFLGLIAVLGGCTTPSGQVDSSPGPSRPAPTVTASRCLGPKAVPSCEVLWGVATRPPTLQAVEAIETEVGRQFQIVYRYHDLAGELPDEAEQQVVQRGTLLHVAIASRIFGSGSVPYADVAAGRYDEVLRRHAEGIAELGVPVYVTFEQEGNQRDKLDVRGTAQEFVAAWRHVHDVFQQAGADNAVWVWVMTGNARNLERAGSLWPGNDVVDWISWNIYNQSGCRGEKPVVSKYESFRTGIATFYDWVTTEGAAQGIDATKPMMISEAGSAQYPDAPEESARWYAQIPDALRHYPQVKAVTLWASGGGGPNHCSYRFQDNDVITQGVAKAGRKLAALEVPTSG
ncbi:hypothetical protein H9L10_01410 [Phycicoccus endophyticus]|uniref:GH26 domain-containing protein n=1 Tax=Phycicoccus endophyticus TaxID=1690220 RepID=A0A7G9R2F8_9MICO|nr:hypothetical protein [Phycicoccus endophyticus]NHI20833.1 hypothetical protein [Phycicoccus endophyticus]QNN49783.1 hypothetical protein H9L10_01410 [Phycicoccus endophyticus]GGL35122.1 hypothetical protein GCM10012283_16910 [Phycicoccus endophyticus]